MYYFFNFVNNSRFILNDIRFVNFNEFVNFYEIFRVKNFKNCIYIDLKVKLINFNVYVDM